MLLPLPYVFFHSVGQLSSDVTFTSFAPKSQTLRLLRSAQSPWNTCSLWRIPPCVWPLQTCWDTATATKGGMQCWSCCRLDGRAVMQSPLLRHGWTKDDRVFPLLDFLEKSKVVFWNNLWSQHLTAQIDLFCCRQQILLIYNLLKVSEAMWPRWPLIWVLVTRIHLLGRKAPWATHADYVVLPMVPSKDSERSTSELLKTAVRGLSELDRKPEDESEWKARKWMDDRWITHILSPTATSVTTWGRWRVVEFLVWLKLPKWPCIRRIIRTQMDVSLKFCYSSRFRSE